MNKSVVFLALVLLMAGMQPSSNASPYAYANSKASQGKKISAKQAANKVKRKYGGKVLKVSASGNGYRVKLIQPDGKIISVYVDGNSGKIKG
tara:strand:+ start:696 stop:971 length:276 start_codon:yes stop_codon:yes gene_type:complete